MRRLSILGIVSLIASAVAVVGTPGTAWANLGASKTFLCPAVPAVHCDPLSSRYGEKVTFGVDVDDYSDSCRAFDDCDDPTGIVEFYDNGAPSPFTSCVLQTGVPGHIPIDYSHCDGIYSGLTVGRHDVKAVYVPAGAHIFDPSSETVPGYLVDVQPTTTSLAQDSAASAYGQPVQLTATVTPDEAPFTGYGALRPSGLVQFLDNGSQFATVNLNSATGTASYTTGTLPPGDHPNLTARYISDGNYLSSVSSALDHGVTKAFTTGSLVTSATSTVYGQPVTLTDTVAPVAPGAGTPTGTVIFTDLAPLVTLSSQSLDGHSPDRAAATISLLPAGTHVISAHYLGDSNSAGNVSNDVTVDVSKAVTTTTLFSSQNPSAFGQSVTFQAGVHVVGTNPGIPSGTVQFKDGSADLGPPRPIIAGLASLTNSTLGGGDHVITAVYSGDDNFNGSTSAPLTQTVTCDRVVTGTVSSVIASGTTCLSNAYVRGGVNVPAGAKLSLVNSTVHGVVSTKGGAGPITICGSTIRGSVKIAGANGFVLIGDTIEDACAGNVIKGSVALSSNTGGFQVGFNGIRGTVTSTGNVGAGPAPNHTSPEVEANDISGNLACSGDSPVVSNESHPNTVAAKRSGECGAPGF